MLVTPARDVLVHPFTGAPVVARPLAKQSIPQHPFMARNDGGSLHNDAYESDTYNRSRVTS